MRMMSPPSSGQLAIITLDDDDDVEMCGFGVMKLGANKRLCGRRGCVVNDDDDDDAKDADTVADAPPLHRMATKSKYNECRHCNRETSTVLRDIMVTAAAPVRDVDVDGGCKSMITLLQLQIKVKDGWSERDGSYWE